MAAGAPRAHGLAAHGPRPELRAAQDTSPEQPSATRSRSAPADSPGAAAVSRSVAAMLPAPRNAADSRGQPLQALPNRPLAGQSPTKYPARPARDPAARRAEDRQHKQPAGLPPGPSTPAHARPRRAEPAAGKPSAAAGAFCGPSRAATQPRPTPPARGAAAPSPGNPAGRQAAPNPGLTRLSAARMAAARPSGPSALITIRGRARQVALSGPRGTYQISQPGNCRSSSRLALTVPHAVSLHGEQDAHLRAVVYLPPARDVAPSPHATAHAPPAR